MDANQTIVALTFACLSLATVPALIQDAEATPNSPMKMNIGRVTPAGPVPSLFVLGSDGAGI